MTMVRVLLKRLVWIGLALLVLWIGYDLATPGRHDLRQFDAHQVGRIETDMWRSYYDHRRAALFGQLVDLLRSQYHMGLWRAVAGGYYAARAAEVFQRGHNRTEYELALPALRKYYSLIAAGSGSTLPVEDVSRLELEWWIVHRERAKHPPGDLEKSLADLQARIFGMPPEHFAEHAKARAEAMVIRDTKAEQGGVTEQDWSRIGELLDKSWVSLHTVVN